MKGRIRNLAVYAYVALAAALSWWLAEMHELRQEQIKIEENSPDFFSEVYYKQEMGLDGIAKNELSAERMQHFKTDGSTHLQKPVMTLYNPNQMPWVIKADSGVMAADGEHLQLNGTVFINREASKTNAALTVNTSDLRVNLASHYAETAAWAEIIGPPNKTAGIGMEATFVSPIHLKLLSKVKGRYEIK
ncbi:LPS export ABC transporter periplasmic protein LptC [Methylomonas sp. MED-D]|uniref:LPS export ABC transporter periplasmic protein LptC n=1 Tax=Methylomonas koyamae TaxID=702114 RepID=A0A177NMR8_9GAMM|nr:MULTISPECIES: LPS export ABC transporter periplasmic protein LptC [Methylomonas]NJA04529.1 LPS export ABC transporter periplasmic protein LptC [Methylococcaceae bacterium WWC4]MDT4331915.1 LPS export ABC transporter periplasmic protein LptC [Methylomonas sp. MV1]OAI19235.1 LPS export ABC transporter periplasmic protein LptC [Methylomonas koyamae]OHX35716.1 LPS export ABC transporter periplasmic protein LptC [Methylomonas sp. LWB]WGS85924.1 LPS export ABC transporter periplasmic protein LptC